MNRYSIIFALALVLFPSVSNANNLCAGHDYICSGSIPIEVGLQHRLQNAFPEVPSACYIISIKHFIGRCADCSDFDKYVRGTAGSCEDVVEWHNYASITPSDVPRDVRCSYRVRIRLKTACKYGFGQLYGNFPRVNFERLGDWVETLN